MATDTRRLYPKEKESHDPKENISQKLTNRQLRPTLQNYLQLAFSPQIPVSKIVPPP